MDGVEVCQRIRENHLTRGMAVIILTARTDEATKLSALQAGANDFLTKPWDIPQLEVTLRRAMEFFTVRRERDALLGAKMQAMGNVLLSSRLAAFALVPVCAGLQCDRAAEAIASFVKTGVAGRRTGSDGDSALRSPDWARLHARQVALVSRLEAQLPPALVPAGLAARTAALASALAAAGVTGISSAANGSATRLSGAVDSTPVLLDVASIQPDCILLLDTFFMIVVHAGSTIGE